MLATARGAVFQCCGKFTDTDVIGGDAAGELVFDGMPRFVFAATMLGTLRPSWSQEHW